MLNANYLMTVFLELVLIFCFSNCQIAEKYLICSNTYFVKSIKFVSKIFTSAEKYLYQLKDVFIRLYIIILAIATNITLGFFMF